MDGVLSQEEINALLNDPGSSSASSESELTDVEKDEIGEIANICMGTAATTLFSLVNRKVEISTPVVSYSSWKNISSEYERPCVFIRIAYTEGLDGNNILILKENDVKIITDLMMGGDGTNIDGELGELHLSAICEAMNQMMGSASTSLSSMLDRKIDISPPTADVIDMTSDIDEGSIDQFLTGNFVKISFHMEIGDLVDSTIMQLYPISFAKEMCEGVMHNMNLGQDGSKKQPATEEAASSTTSGQNVKSVQQTSQNPQTQAKNSQQMNTQSMMERPDDEWSANGGKSDDEWPVDDGRSDDEWSADYGWSADDGRVSDRTAGKCTTSTVFSFFRWHCGRVSGRKYWSDYGCSAGSYG